MPTSLTIPGKANKESEEIQPKNLFEVIQIFKNHVQQEFPTQGNSISNQVQTALMHYTLPAWGLPPHQGKKMTKVEKLAADNLAKQVSLEQLKDALNVQQKVFDELKSPKSIQRNYRAHLKKLLNFCDQHQWWSVQVSNSSSGATHYHPLWQKGSNSDLIKTTCKPWKPRFGLGSIKGDVISKMLKQQLVSLQNFQIDTVGNRTTTAKQIERRILQILGAEPYRQGVASTEELNLETMIFFVPIKTGLRALSPESSLAERLIRLEELKEKARQAAIEVERNLKPVLRWYREVRQVAPGMEKDIIVTLIHVAKFLYRDETDKLQVSDYEDIPVIVVLRKLLKEVMKRSKTAAPVIDTEKKWLDWSEWIEFVDTLRKEAILLSYTRSDREIKPSAVSNRVLRGLGQSLQIFLITGIWSFQPPDRQRTIRELEEGKSLVWKNNLWQIHLKPGDTKIDNEEEWIPINDMEFEDGTRFYQYLRAWLHDCKALPTYASLPWSGGLRKVFNPSHNFCFTMVQSGKPLTNDAVCTYLKRRAYRLTGKATTPHLIRSMYITHLEDSGTSESLMVSTAKSMHHSRSTQSKHYDKRQKSKKMQPGLDLAVQVARSILLN